jgi:hypothetical protein
MEEEPFSTLTRGAESNPARVLWRDTTTTEKYLFSNIHTQRILTEYRTRCSSRQNDYRLEPRGSRTAVPPISPI